MLLLLLLWVGAGGGHITVCCVACGPADATLTMPAARQAACSMEIKMLPVKVESPTWPGTQTSEARRKNNMTVLLPVGLCGCLLVTRWT